MSPHTYAVRPHWDPGSRELSFKSICLKRFRRTGPNQQLLLTAFEEDGWPRIIEDPLPPIDEVVPAQRLRDTVKNLNRSLRRKLIQFSTDGTGKRVVWRDLSAESAAAQRR